MKPEVGGGCRSCTHSVARASGVRWECHPFEELWALLVYEAPTARHSHGRSLRRPSLQWLELLAPLLEAALDFSFFVHRLLAAFSQGPVFLVGPWIGTLASLRPHPLPSSVVEFLQR